MAILNHSHFDVIEFIKKSKEYGASEQLAEFQARAIEKISEEQSRIIQEQNAKFIALESKELATKGDLREIELKLQKEIEQVRKEIEQAKNQLLFWMFAMLTGFAVFFLGALAKGFHWL